MHKSTANFLFLPNVLNSFLHILLFPLTSYSTTCQFISDKRFIPLAVSQYQTTKTGRRIRLCVRLADDITVARNFRSLLPKVTVCVNLKSSSFSATHRIYAAGSSSLSESTKRQVRSPTAYNRTKTSTDFSACVHLCLKIL